MKYITFEKNEHTIALLSTYKFETISNFWIYNVYGIDDSIILPIELKNACFEISKEVALGSIFSCFDFSQTQSINFKGENANIKYFKSAIGISDNQTLLPREKFKYIFTEADHLNSSIYIKLILIHYIENHYDSLDEQLQLTYNDKINNIKTNINSCNTNADCFIIMHNHFNYSLTILDTENKLGTSVPGAIWNLSIPNGGRTKYKTDEEVDTGPTIDNIDSSVFGIEWTIGEQVIVQ